jgi:hypothetical protein
VARAAQRSLMLIRDACSFVISPLLVSPRAPFPSASDAIDK